MVAAVDPELAEVLRREGITLVRVVDSSSGASKFVAHVRDSSGRDLLLKRGTGLRGNAEAAVLQAYAGTGCVPGNVCSIDEATFVCDWFDGEPLNPSATDISAKLRSCGEALRLMHGAAPPQVKLMPISRRISPEWVESDLGVELSQPMRSRAAAAARQLADCNPAEKVLLHGDSVPQNILFAGRRLCFIDPIGFVGPAGWDCAQLAVAVEGRNRRANLEDVVAGYGLIPQKVEAAFTYLTMVFLAKHLAMERESSGARAKLTSELRKLAESL